MSEQQDKQALKDLGARIKQVRQREKTRDIAEKRPPSAMQIGIELVAGVLVGSVLGYYVDKWLETLPLFFILGFFLGVAAGGLNIYKLAAKQHGVADKGE